MPQIKSKQSPIDRQLLATYDVADAVGRASQVNEGVIEAMDSLAKTVDQLQEEMKELKEAVQELTKIMKGE